MATLKTIRKRISTVKNTQKITKAMKMVAAAKLRRAQNALLGGRPHALALEASLARLMEAARAKNLLKDWQSPLLKKVEPPKKAHIFVITSDRGLCGGFNGNLLRAVEHFSKEEGKKFETIDLSVLGRKGRDYYKAKKVELKETQTWESLEIIFTQAEVLAKEWTAKFEKGEFDCLYLAFNVFKSAISQEPTLLPVLPLDLSKLKALQEVEEKEETPSPAKPIAWGGDPRAMIEIILKRLVATYFFRALLESQASELGSRMSAMDNATNNAGEMIASLTLQYNRARQAAITTELMDIVNGAEALG